MQTPGLNTFATDTQYVLVVAGKPEGPFSIAELRAKKIKPGDFVKTPGMDDYKEVHEVAELRQLFGFSRQPLPMQYFGSFDQRATASVVDWFIVLAVFVLAAFVVMLFSLLALPGEENKVIRIGISVAIVALTIPARLIYSVVMESGPKQGTYGKQLLKIRVCDMYGERIDTSKAVGRNVAKILSVATFFVGYLIIFFNKKQQALHDIVADTLVIKDRLDG
ncbi:RDD family protein [Mucilaginibacter gilvus]|uniref:RDD family protein n=1 Tax=Mucilaginibacter gilvus TaxID=2305909 RepID=A0A444MSK4_9SPHI|nr:RDD family protein [Mucilaginibacter gilvus]RWY55593.1 RDD family protein [Mucilaginibacter gilvus]